VQCYAVMSCQWCLQFLTQQVLSPLSAALLSLCVVVSAGFGRSWAIASVIMAIMGVQSLKDSRYTL
jgi:hypothetical protein